MTEWNEYRQLDLERLGAAAAARRFLDCRNVYDHDIMTGHGYDYRSFGRPRH